MSESVEVRPYFAQGERYPSLVGVRVGGDEYETAYVSKAELMSVMDENAKLRELVRRMRQYMVGAVEHCGYDAQTTGYTSSAHVWRSARM